MGVTAAHLIVCAARISAASTNARSCDLLDVRALHVELNAVGVRARLEDLGCDDVRIAVGTRAAVLEVTATLRVGGARDTDGAAAVGYAIRERVDVGRLVFTRQPALVALAVRVDVLLVLGAELADRLLDLREATRLAHLLRREIGVAAGAVPVAWDRLRVERDVHAEVLAHALEDVARDHQLITRLDAYTRADLVLPLAGHHLCVGARNLEASEKAGLVVRFRDGAPIRAVGARTAVVRALRAGVAARRPAERRDLIDVEERVLLFEAEPRRLALPLAEGLDRGRTCVGRQRRAAGRVRVRKHEDVVTATEWIAENGLWLDDNLRVLARRLVSRGAVIVPV